MVRRFAEILLAFLLACTFAGAALSEAEAPAAADSPSERKVILAFAATYDSRDKDVANAALYLGKLLLCCSDWSQADVEILWKGHYDYNYNYNRETTGKSMDASITNLAGCVEGYGDKDALEKLKPENLPAEADVWIIELRNAFPEAETSDTDAETEGSASESTGTVSNVTLHYVCIAKGEAPTDDTAKAAATQEACVDFPTPVQTLFVSLDNPAAACSALFSAVRDWYGFLIPGEPVSGTLADNVWTFPYDALLPADTETPLLLYASAALDTLTIAPETEEAEPEVIASVLQAGEGSWLWLPGAPSEPCSITAVTTNITDESNAPTLTTYRLPSAADLTPAYKNDEGIDPLPGEISWYRGAHTLSLSIDFPSGIWTPQLYIDDEFVQDFSHTNASTGDTSSSRWETTYPADTAGSFTLRVDLVRTDWTVSHGEPRTVTVLNRAPRTNAEAETHFTLYFDKNYPQMNKHFSYADYFSDKDNDALTCSVSVSPEGAGEIVIDEDQSGFTYQPLEDVESVTLTLYATDPYYETATTTIKLNQQSIATALKNWRMTPDVNAFTNPSKSPDNAYTAVFHKDATLVFSSLLTADSPESAIYKGITAQLDKTALADNLTITCTITDASEQAVSDPIPLVIEQGDNKLTATLSLPSPDKSGAYTYTFDATFANKTSLPNLIDTLTVDYPNTAPTLFKSATLSKNTIAFLWGLPGTYQPLTPEDIAVDPAALFTDAEDDALTYTLQVSGSGGCTVNEQWQKSDTAEADETGNDAIRAYENAANESDTQNRTLSLTPTSPGVLNFSLVANDGEWDSDPLEWQVYVLPVFWLAVAGTGLLLVVVAVILLIRYLRLPVFGNVCVSAALLPADAPSVTDYPQVAMPLRYYQKRSVTLLTLLLYYQLPPLPGLDTAMVGDIRLSPAHNGGFALVRLGRNAAGHGIALDGRVQAKSSKPYVVNRNVLTITVPSQGHAGGVSLFFTRGNGRY